MRVDETNLMEEVGDVSVARCGSYCSPELRRCEVADFARGAIDLVNKKKKREHQQMRHDVEEKNKETGGRRDVYGDPKWCSSPAAMAVLRGGVGAAWWLLGYVLWGKRERGTWEFYRGQRRVEWRSKSSELKGRNELKRFRKRYHCRLPQSKMHS